MGWPANQKRIDFGNSGVNVLFFFLFHFGVENYKGHWNYNFLETPFLSVLGMKIQDV